VIKQQHQGHQRENLTEAEMTATMGDVERCGADVQIGAF